jgi:hypothetical protein
VALVPLAKYVLQVPLDPKYLWRAEVAVHLLFPRWVQQVAEEEVDAAPRLVLPLRLLLQEGAVAEV